MFSGLLDNSTQTNGYKLQQRRFCPNLRKNCMVDEVCSVRELSPS